MNTIDTTIRVGATVRDAMTGFTGTAMSRVELMGGNVQFAVQPKLAADAKPGEFPDAVNIDHHLLDFVDAGLSPRATEPPPVTVELGDKVYDIVTGLEGIAVSRITFLNGCIYYNVQQQKMQDKQTGIEGAPEPMFLSQARLGVVKPAAAAVQVPKATTAGRVPGGPSTCAQRAA
jgi:hypothetical protein